LNEVPNAVTKLAAMWLKCSHIMKNMSHFVTAPTPGDIGFPLRWPVPAQ